MTRVYNTVLLAVTLLGACNHNESGAPSSPLIGEWITTACEQAVDGSDNPIDLWMRGIFMFEEGGVIVYSYEEHEDSSCTGTATIVTPDVIGETGTFEELRSVLLEEGINGTVIRFTSPVDPDTGDAFSVDAFYTINSGTLCFSRGARFVPSGYQISMAGASAIDFENCLKRYSVP